MPLVGYSNEVSLKAIKKNLGASVWSLGERPLSEEGGGEG